jgi:hypothetical protein
VSKLKMKDQITEMEKAIKELQDIVLILANQLAELRKDDN